MAGSYPDAPSRRMAWDRDGCVAYHRRTDDTATAVEWSDVEKEEINDEDQVDSVTLTPALAAARAEIHVIFPELREIDGFFARFAYNDNLNTPTPLESAPDTTNGFDGTWASLISNYTQPNGDVYNAAAYRTAITSLAANAQRGLRLRDVSGIGGAPNRPATIRALHVYGTISPGETPDRLLWLDEATGLEFTGPLDAGDVPRGGSQDYELRLRNNSATFTIETIQYTAESLFLNAGAWWTFTLPGGSTFQATRQIASIAPATTSGLITARRITPGDEVLGPHAARFFTSHTALT